MAPNSEGFAGSSAHAERRICVVTGGRGFAASWLVMKLLQSQRWIVRIADLPRSLVVVHDHHDDERDSVLRQALDAGTAVFVAADVTCKGELIQECRALEFGLIIGVSVASVDDDVNMLHRVISRKLWIPRTAKILQRSNAFEGASVVFHMAAPDSSNNNFQLHYSVTVQGAQNVISACLECQVKKLIYTSSASVVFDGVHDIRNADESRAYPDKHNDIYSEMKAQAESMILETNGRKGLQTCSLRPSSIFGPGDKLFVPSIVKQAKAGKMKFLIGNGKNMYDFTYVENVAHAHICAVEALDSTANDVAGKAFFITNMEPMCFWDFVSIILEGLGYQRPYIIIPEKLAILVASVTEWCFQAMGSERMPQLTSSRIKLVSRTRTFSCSRAHKRIGYSPIVSLKEGIKRTLDSFQHLRSETVISQERSMDGSSKVHKMLGGGRVADILLWRDDKKTFAIAMILAFIIYYFCLCGHRFVYAAARFLLLTISAVFIYGFLPSPMLGYQLEEIPAAIFEISEQTLRVPLHCLRSGWNNGVDILKNLANGKDWELFLKAIAILYLFKFVGSISFSILVVTGYMFMFTFFCIYEQKQEEIDSLTQTAIGMVSCMKNTLVGKLPREAMGYFKKN